MKLKKLLFTGVLALALLIPTAAFATQYSYGYTYDFKYGLTSKVYKLWAAPYPKDLIYIENTSTSASSKNFYVDLKKDNGFGIGVIIGTAVFPCDGSAVQGIYTNDSSIKNYLMNFRKADDGYYVNGYGRIYDKR